MSLGERIKKLRQEKGLTQSQLGSCLNLAESTISLYESGKRSPKYEMLKKLSAFFNVSLDYLLGYSGEKTPDGSVVQERTTPYRYGDNTLLSCIGLPVITGVKYDNNSLIYEKSGKIEYICNIGYSENHYYFQADTDSMSGDSICRGDLLLVKETNEADNGDICLVAVENTGVFLCRFFQRENHFILQFSNPAYPPRIFSARESSQARIIGKVLELRRKYKPRKQ